MSSSCCIQNRVRVCWDEHEKDFFASEALEKLPCNNRCQWNRKTDRLAVYPN